jgi:hypothetical protein
MSRIHGIFLENIKATYDEWTRLVSFVAPILNRSMYTKWYWGKYDDPMIYLLKIYFFYYR